MTLSAYYLVQNEAEFLERSLASVEPFVDEIILLDNNSTDDTAQIAQSHSKVQYYHAPENLFEVGEHVLRERGISLCKGDWILQIDGDVVLGNDWRDEIEVHLGGDCGYGELPFYEHVGSFEYVHRNLSQKTFAAFFRKHEGLRFVGGHTGTRAHGSLIPTAQPPRSFHLKAGWFHYGYTKKDIVSRIARNIQRGDWGGDKEALHSACATEEAIWKRLSEVERVPYGYRDVPHSMRDLFGQTYWLDLEPTGKIKARYPLTTLQVSP